LQEIHVFVEINSELQRRHGCILWHFNVASSSFTHIFLNSDQ